MERRLERWLFQCRPGKTLLTPHPQPGLRISGCERVVSKTHLPFALIVDAAYPRNPAFESGLWHRIDRISLPGKSSNPGLCPEAGQGDGPDRKQSLKRGAVG